MCVETCPEAFELDDTEGKSAAIEAADFDAERADEAIAICPGECIFKE